MSKPTKKEKKNEGRKKETEKGELTVLICHLLSVYGIAHAFQGILRRIKKNVSQTSADCHIPHDTRGDVGNS
jgi:hypothetical protein